MLLPLPTHLQGSSIPSSQAHWRKPSHLHVLLDLVLANVWFSYFSGKLFLMLSVSQVFTDHCFALLVFKPRASNVLIGYWTVSSALCLLSITSMALFSLQSPSNSAWFSVLSQYFHPPAIFWFHPPVLCIWHYMMDLVVCRCHLPLVTWCQRRNLAQICSPSLREYT